MHIDPPKSNTVHVKTHVTETETITLKNKNKNIKRRCTKNAQDYTLRMQTHLWNAFHRQVRLVYVTANSQGHLSEQTVSGLSSNRSTSCQLRKLLVQATHELRCRLQPVTSSAKDIELTSQEQLKQEQQMFSQLTFKMNPLNFLLLSFVKIRLDTVLFSLVIFTTHSHFTKERSTA